MDVVWGTIKRCYLCWSVLCFVAFFFVAFFFASSIHCSCFVSMTIHMNIEYTSKSLCMSQCRMHVFNIGQTITKIAFCSARITCAHWNRTRIHLKVKLSNWKAPFYFARRCLCSNCKTRRKQRESSSFYPLFGMLHIWNVVNVLVM